MAVSICDDLDLSMPVLTKTKSLIECSCNEENNAYGVNLLSAKSPTGVAAGGVYAAGLLTNTVITQEEVAEVSGMSTYTIRKRYQEILFLNGVKQPERAPAVIKRIMPYSSGRGKKALENSLEYYEWREERRDRLQ